MREIQNFNRALALILKEYREKTGFTQADLAARIGGSAIYVRKMEAAQQTPTTTVFMLLSEAFGLTPEEFMREVTQKIQFLNNTAMPPAQ